MTPSEIGTIYNFLLKNKVVRGFEAPNIRRNKIEKEIASTLDRNNQRLEDLEEFLATQGVGIRILGAQEYHLATHGYAYVLIRSLNATEIPAHLNIDQIWTGFRDDRRNDTKQTTVIWTSYLYLHLLYFLYTIDNRTIESISKFHETWLDLDNFKTNVIAAIDDLRRATGEQNYGETQIRACLVASTEKEIQSRVERFIKTLEQVGVLEQMNDDGFRMGRSDEPRSVYRQSLWSAVDVAENFKRYGSLLLNPPEANAVHTLSKITN